MVSPDHGCQESVCKELKRAVMKNHVTTLSTVNLAAINTNDARVLKGIILNIPKEERGVAKKLGARYDRSSRAWVIPEEISDYEPLKKWMIDPSISVSIMKSEFFDFKKKIMLNIPKKERNKAKELGARYDRSSRAWVIPEEISDYEPLKKWIVKEEVLTEFPENQKIAAYSNVFKDLGIFISSPCLRYFILDYARLISKPKEDLSEVDLRSVIKDILTEALKDFSIKVSSEYARLLYF
ncbi:MAG: DUF5710 domain-containing protein [Holophagales bacterium]|jgi:hypothetical protein|nr:DUF5710 domain-containing protein [Holophagales bacterium]